MYSTCKFVYIFVTVIVSFKGLPQKRLIKSIIRNIFIKILKIHKKACENDINFPRKFFR